MCFILFISFFSDDIKPVGTRNKIQEVEEEIQIGESVVDPTFDLHQLSVINNNGSTHSPTKCEDTEIQLCESAVNFQYSHNDDSSTGKMSDESLLLLNTDSKLKGMIFSIETTKNSYI